MIYFWFLKWFTTLELFPYTMDVAFCQRELSALRAQKQSLELQQDELVLAVPHATRPLLRQIETLQNSVKIRTKTWYNHNIYSTCFTYNIFSILEISAFESQKAVPQILNFFILFF